MTLIAETEGILNSQSLTVETISQPASVLPLAPLNILTMVVMSPTGNFSRPELCCQKRWRHIQHIVNKLWARLRKKYLQSLQPRTKWKSGRRNFIVGAIVLVFQNESIQNKWPMARLIQVFKNINGYVGNVKLRIGETRIRDEVSTVFL